MGAMSTLLLALLCNLLCFYQTYADGVQTAAMRCSSPGVPTGDLTAVLTQAYLY